MSHLTRLLDASAEFLAPVLLATALKAMLVLLLAVGVTAALRRASAAQRHLVWALALLGILVLPVLALVVPGWRVGLPPTQPPLIVVAPAPPASLAELSLRGPATAASLLPATASPRTAEPAPAPDHVASSAVPGLASWLVLAWAAGTALTAVPLATGLLLLGRARRRLRPFADRRLRELLDQLVRELGLRRSVRLLESTGRAMPATWGVWRPVVLLPRDATGWSAERLRAVLLHELAHVQRQDCLTQVLARLACALHWFNPLAWWALSRLRIEQERACDDVVLAHGPEAPDYAGHLLAVTAEFPRPVAGSAVALAMSAARRIERRLRAVLDPARCRQRVGRRRAALATLAAVALLAPLAAVTLPRAEGSPIVELAEETEAPQAPADKETDEAKLLEDVRTKLLELYVKPPDQKAILQGAIKGMLSALNDPHSDYLSPETLAGWESQVRGQLTGIGAQLKAEDGKVLVVTPLPDSPALKAGLRPGDVITAVDGKPSAGRELTDVVKEIIGKEGTVVKLTLRRADGKEQELAITRAPVKVETVKGFRRGAEQRWNFFLDEPQKVGYVQVIHFGPDTARELRTAVEGLQARGMQGLILDLRFCPGGLLNTAVDLAKLFLAQGTIVSVKGGKGQEQTLKADGKGTLGNFPLVVLVNEQTASAAEVLAGALKDNERALVVGARTYGKGSVQSLIKLGDDGGAMRLTTTYYYLPSGRNIHRRPGEKDWGVDPTDGYYVAVGAEQRKALHEAQIKRDVLPVPGAAQRQAQVTPESLQKDFGDPQLAAALKTLLARLTTGQYVKVGQENAALVAQMLLREEAEKRREALLKSLEKVNKELKDLENSLKDDGKP